MMKKNMIVLAALMAVLAVLTPRSWAQNLQDAQLAQADMSDYAAIVYGGAATSNLMTLYYVGSSTEALVTVSASAMSFFAPFNAAEATLSSSGGIGTLGVVTFGTSFSGATMGPLCDYINTSKYYRCVLTGAFRGDTWAFLKTQTEASGTCNLAAPGGCTITNNANDIIRYGIIPSMGKRVVLKHVEVVSTSSSDNVYVWGVPRKASSLYDTLGNQLTSGTTVWLQATGSTSIVYQPAAGQYQNSPWMEFAPNKLLSVYNGKANTPGCNYTWGGGFCLNGTTYDGSVTVGVGATGSGNAQSSADYLRVFWSEK